MAEPKKKINYSRAWIEAKSLLLAHRSRLAFGLVLMLISRSLGLVLPASSKYVIDEVIGKGKPEMLTTVALAAGFATFLQAATAFAISQILGVAAQKAITEMRKRVQAHVERLPVSYFDSVRSGQLASRIMQDADGIRNLVGSGLVQFTGGILTAIMALSVLLYINWQMTLMTLFVLAIFGGGLAWGLGRLRPLFRERNEISSQVNGRLIESLSGIRVVKAYTAERREELVFAKGAHKLFRNVAKSMTGVSSLMAFSSSIVGTIGIIIFILGGRAVADKSMTLGDLFMYIAFTGLMAMPVVELASIGTQITEAFAGLDRIHEILSQPLESADDDGKRALPTLAGEMEFRNVSFAYPDGPLVLKNVSFSAAAGSTTAIVGSSGSGKSTLMSLILNFNQPKEGALYVDGQNLAGIRIDQYRRHLGIVFQDNFLFDGNLADNISFSKPGATRQQVIEASRTAHCHDFIEAFEKGYDTVVGERGVKLSGGQRQRVAIARAILADPRILILDEATSSLDSESEALIQQGLNNLRRGRTTFVIAHRLSTIRNADQILVLEHGEIVERGNHQQLMALGGRYRDLHDRQYQFETNLFVNPGEELVAPQTVSI